uniref:UBX domain-containing protein n=1 Tax=Pinguiococcus pyrenoidosus TaxID=172671 RepID=A0A7R9U614_9STRA
MTHTSEGSRGFWAKMASDEFVPPFRAPRSEDGADAGLVQRLEAEIQRLKSSLREKDGALADAKKVQHENSELQALARDYEALLDDMLAVMDTNESLRAENRQMKSFLRDYGLVWVGEPEEPHEPVAEADQTTWPSFGDVGLSVEVLLDKLRELNDLVDGTTQVARDSQRGAARLHRPRGLLVEVFRDGVRLGGPTGTELGDVPPASPLQTLGKVRSWRDAALETFVRDVLDGFFPQEWRVAYPDGVLLDVQDRHREGAPRHRAFQGKGRRLGTFPPGDSACVQRLSDSADPRKGGCAKDVERGLAGSGPKVVKTPKCLKVEGDGDLGGDRVCRVQVRQPGGQRASRSLIVHILASERVADLCEAIEDANKLPEGAHCAIELRSTYPCRQLDRDLKIAAAGLSPSGTVVVQDVHGKQRRGAG